MVYKKNLWGADLGGADLRCENLRGADLKYANLIKANLSGADLKWADLTCANLSYANLRGADLRNADLTKADLTGADLIKADLSGADFREADLTGADITVPYVCPMEGSFVCYKKARDMKGNMYIVVLEVPADALRLSGTSNKCRCNKATVLRIENYDGRTSELEEVLSIYDENFVYKVGETVTVSDFDTDRWTECSKGIHFFIDRNEAIRY